MSIKINRIVKGMKEAIKSDKRTTTPYDTVAKVVKVEDGIAWVHIDGGVDQTPVKISASVKVGDEVQVRISGGQAWAYGNYTAPPTDDSTANKAVEEVTLTNKAVKKVREIVNAVSKIAGDTAQYFWHTQQGTDTGVHITEIPKEDFLADPENGGGNLLARSNGIAVRDGLTELAQFGADGARIGQENDSNVEITEEYVKMYKDGLECVSFELPSEQKTYIDEGFHNLYPTTLETGDAITLFMPQTIPTHDGIDCILRYHGVEYKQTLTQQGGYDEDDPSTYYYYSINQSDSQVTFYSNADREVLENEELDARFYVEEYSASSYLGCYPKRRTDKPIMFAVGNGTPTTPSNAFEVDYYGNATLAGSLTADISGLFRTEAMRIFCNYSAGTYKYQDVPTVDGYTPIAIIGVGAWSETSAVTHLYECRLVGNQARVAWDIAIATSSAVDLNILYVKG